MLYLSAMDACTEPVDFIYKFLDCLILKSEVQQLQKVRIQLHW